MSKTWSILLRYTRTLPAYRDWNIKPILHHSTHEVSTWCEFVWKFIMRLNLSWYDFSSWNLCSKLSKMRSILLRDTGEFTPWLSIITMAYMPTLTFQKMGRKWEKIGTFLNFLYITIDFSKKRKTCSNHTLFFFFFFFCFLLRSK